MGPAAAAQEEAAKAKAAQEERIWEEPLKEWVDVKGSKLKLWDKVKAIWGLGKIWWSGVGGGGSGDGGGEL